MIKTIKFNPDGDKLIADIQFGGLVIASYTMRLYSDNVICDKILQDERGNNHQPHDDSFWLRNKSNESEPVASNDGRLVELIVNVNTDRDTPYTITLVIMQGGKLLGEATYEGQIKVNDGGQFKSLGVILTTR